MRSCGICCRHSARSARVRPRGVSVTPDISRCRNCGTELAPSEVEGLCPHCLMELAIVARDADDSPRALITSGDRVGPYKIVSLIGRGGMGEIYLASDTRLDR